HLLLALPLKLLGGQLWGASLLWWVLSSLVPFFAWRWTRQMVGPVAGAVTALCCALWPLYVTYAGFFLSETPALALLLCALWLAGRAARASGKAAILQGVLAGLAAGIGVVIRPQVALNLLIVALVLLCGRRRISVLAGLIAGAAVPIL